MRKVLPKDKMLKILNLIETFLPQCEQVSDKKKRGRHPKFKEELVILSIILKNYLNLSFRELELNLLQIFPREQTPDFSSLFYRMKTIDQKKLKCITTEIEKEMTNILDNKVR
ncbi:MAG: hypothetical protein N3C57_02155 [Aquificaceae bacterium]|nr:hypothetical protein [Aquificaceae bacterium]MCX8075812.1 hypothetical protein [Aquificaceae bacterium]MDW8095277.1 hypothetical protein [Aquificaceae bacterium]MDW8433355.1 hypothetical protein [Aquificaceae bacterium]